MTFRRRIALLAGLSFVAAVFACSVIGYVVVRQQMLDRLDSDLNFRVANDPLSLPPLSSAGQGRPFDPGPGGDSSGNPAGRGNGRRTLPTDVLYQSVAAAGTATTPTGQDLSLPVDRGDVALASEPPGSVRLRDVTIGADNYRMITASTGHQVGVQIARPLTEVEDTLHQFAVSLIVVSLVGSVVAAGVGWWVARRSARPVEALTLAAERVADTLEFDVGHMKTHDDEIGRLTATISRMLDVLRTSREQQQRLVVDASHEFRTPLTSLRANIGMLDHPDLDVSTRAEIVDDVRVELAELTDLASELVELATDSQQVEEPSMVALHPVASRVAARATKRTGQQVLVEGPGWDAWGQAGMLERAIQNLVDNACKWNPRGQPIEIRVEEGALTVRDHGPGIPESERPLVFERFYRTDSARSLPGSGLGLAIVAQIVDQHGGTVTIDDAEGGGAAITMHLPPRPTVDA